MGAAAQSRPEDRVTEFREVFNRVEAEIGRVIVGHQAVVRKVLSALFCGGHVLIEGVPGLAKTLLVGRARGARPQLQAHPVHARPDAVGHHRHQFLNEADGRRAVRVQSPARSSPISCSPTKSTAPRPRPSRRVLEAMEERQVTVVGDDLSARCRRSSSWRRRTRSSWRAPIRCPKRRWTASCSRS